MELNKNSVQILKLQNLSTHHNILFQTEIKAEDESSSRNYNKIK